MSELESELKRIKNVYDLFTQEVRQALHDNWGHGRTHVQYVADIKRLREELRKAQGPPITLLAKLGSIAVHADEMLSTDGHIFDRAALQSVLNDPEVKQWIEDMGPLLPQKRNLRR